MSVWIEVDGQRLQPLEDGSVLWEHDTLPGYRVPRHMVSSRAGATWNVLNRNPLTLTPSLHCDPALGGCGLHGHVLAGRWS